MKSTKTADNLRRITISAFAAIVGAFAVSAAAMVTTPAVQITKILTYTDYGLGDVLFDVNTTIADCDGFWLSPGDGGFKNAYAVLMLAKASSTAVVAYACETQLWSGSAAKYCRIRSLTLE